MSMEEEVEEAGEEGEVGAHGRRRAAWSAQRKLVPRRLEKKVCYVGLYGDRTFTRPGGLARGRA